MEERDVSEVVTCSEAAVVAGVVVVVDLWVVEEVVAPLVVAVDTVAVLVAVAVVVVAIVLVVVGAGEVLLDRVTYKKGDGVGGRNTPGGYG